jgi:hypothetical protein
MEVLKLTKEQRNEIYGDAYDNHLRDLECVKGTDYGLDGMCGQLKYALECHCHIEFAYDDDESKLGGLLPEFAAMKPKNRKWNEYWWKTKNTLKTRTNKYKLLIKQTS